MLRLYFGIISPTCDGCGKRLPSENSEADAYDAMRREGWGEVGVKDLCPICMQQYGESGVIPGPPPMWGFTTHRAEPREVVQTE